ncbi:MAG: hypothetical protein EZS28_016961, partial [Streblomastix strix]
CITVKKKITNVLWKITLKNKEPISAVTVGTDQDGQAQVYVAAGQTVFGISKINGKIFKTVETDVTETINQLIVLGNNYWVSGEYVHNQFGEQEQFFSSDDKITSMELIPVQQAGTQPLIALGCADGVIRVVRSETSPLEVPVEGSITALANYRRESGAVVRLADDELEKPVIFGTAEGTLGLLMIGRMTYRRGWLLPGNGSINSISVYDLNRSGLPVIIVGRDSGLLQVLTFETAEMLTIAAPRMSFEYKLNESICSVGGGILTSPNFDEVVVVTFSGKIICFTTEQFQEDALKVVNVQQNDKTKDKKKVKGEKKGEQISGNAGGEGYSAGQLVPHLNQDTSSSSSSSSSTQQISPNNSPTKITGSTGLSMGIGGPDGINSGIGSDGLPINPIQQPAFKMKAELQESSSKKLEELAKQVIQLQTKLAHLQNDYDKTEKRSIPTKSDAKIKTSLILLQDEPRHQLSIDCSVPLEFIGIHTDVYADIELIQGNNERPSSQLQQKKGQSQQKGNMADEIVKQAADKAIASSKASTAEISGDVAGQPKIMNEITITGDFTAIDAHAWLHACLDFVPPRMQNDVGHLEFISAFLGTELIADYKNKELKIRSDNISALAIIKEYVSKITISTMRRTSVSMAIIANLFVDFCVFHGFPYESKLQQLCKMMERPFSLGEGLQMFIL